MKEKNRQLNKDWSFKNLVDLKEIFEKAEIRYWIECGLLLGLYREGDMIAGDEDDIDIGLFKEDASKLDKALLKFIERGLNIKRMNRSADGEINALALRRVSRVDIHVVDRKNDIVYFPMYRRKHIKPAKWAVYVYPRKCFEKLETIKWRGIEFPCPNNIEEYLIARYGEDWRINKIETGEWTNCRDTAVNPCLQIDWTNEDLNKLL